MRCCSVNYLQKRLFQTRGTDKLFIFSAGDFHLQRFCFLLMIFCFILAIRRKSLCFIVNVCYAKEQWGEGIHNKCSQYILIRFSYINATT